MNETVEYWTITRIKEEGVMVAVQVDSKEAVWKALDRLRVAGQDMDDVSVFPPQQSLTYQELLKYRG